MITSVYEASYRLFLASYENNIEEINKWEKGMGSADHARSFRACTLDFGRRTGKTKWALDQIEERNAVILTFNHSTLDMLRRSYNKRFTGHPPFMVLSRVAERLRSTHARSTPMSIKMMDAGLVIFDEPHMMHSEDILEVMHQCPNTTKFVFLGSWL